MTLTTRSTAAAKPVLFISVSLGWAIRNFFQTGIVNGLSEYFDIVALATPKAGRSLRELGFDRGIRVLEIDTGEEPLPWKLSRQLKKKIYMEGRQSATEAIWEKYFPRPFYQKLGGEVIKSVIRFFDANRLYSVVDRMDLNFNRDARFAHLFSKYRPALYFATHATAYFEESLLRNARAANVPSVFMILSWDHLSSKILLDQGHHAVLVWNDHTKQEVLQTYPRYRPEQIRIMGIPQYDPYATAPGLSYAEWCRKYGLDPAKRTILFSTMPQSRHEQQHIILEGLLKTIVEGKRLPGDLQVLIKCHPFDNYQGYDALVGRYPAAIHRNSLDPSQSQEDWIPAPTEMEASRDALCYCTLNINIFSTVTIEAAYFDKPVVHIAFDPQPVQNRIPCHEYYNWDHFKHIVDMGATILVHSFDELYDAVNRSIASPSQLATPRRRLVEKYIGRPVGTASNAVVHELVEICQSLEGDLHR